MTTYWNDNKQSVPRSLVHLLSGKKGTGGVSRGGSCERQGGMWTGDVAGWAGEWRTALQVVLGWAARRASSRAAVPLLSRSCSP